MPEIADSRIADFLQTPLNEDPIAPLMRTCAIRWRSRKRNILKAMLVDMIDWLDNRPSPFVEIAAIKFNLIDIRDVL